MLKNEAASEIWWPFDSMLGLTTKDKELNKEGEMEANMLKDSYMRVWM